MKGKIAGRAHCLPGSEQIGTDPVITLKRRLSTNPPWRCAAIASGTTYRVPVGVRPDHVDHAGATLARHPLAP